MKRMNPPLLIGSILLLGLLCVILMPEVFTSNSPYTIQQLRFLSEDGVFAVEKAPFRPSPEFPLGTDDLGRDIWSYIAYGTRTTILLSMLIAFSQFLLALPMALLGGAGHKGIKTLTHHASLVFSAIPALLLSILILQIDFFASLNKFQSILAFVLVLALVGWPKLGMLLTERVEALQGQAFIMGEVAIGKKKLRIALENLIPHLFPEMIVLYFMEVARTLSMMMQLGLFGVFIGNLRLVMDSQNGILTFYNISYEPEWASMLSTSRTYLTLAPWTVIFPALAFFVSVLAFNLFGEGLRETLQRKDSGLTSLVRKILVLDFKALWKGMYHNRKRSIALILMAVSVVTLTLANQSRVTFALPEEAFLEEPQVMMGTESAANAAKAISAVMTDLGVEPVVGNTHVVPYDTGRAYQIVKQEMVMQVDAQTGEGISLPPGEAFSFLSVGKGEGSGDVVDATEADLFSMEDFRPFEGQFVLLDTSYYSEVFIEHLIGKMSQAVSVEGILLIAKEGEQISNLVTDERSTAMVIRVSREVGERLKRTEGIRVTAVATTRLLEGPGRNIMGVYRGADRVLVDEYIAVGLRYNYLDKTGQRMLDFQLELMKQLCGLEENRRSILFLFFDGTLSERHHGIHAIADEMPVSPQKIKVYLDLTALGEEEPLRFSTHQAPVTRQFAWSLGQMLHDLFERGHIPTMEMETTRSGSEHFFLGKSSRNAMFWGPGVATIHLEGEPVELEAIGRSLLEAISRNNY